MKQIVYFCITQCVNYNTLTLIILVLNYILHISLCYSKGPEPNAHVFTNDKQEGMQVLIEHTKTRKIRAQLQIPMFKRASMALTSSRTITPITARSFSVLNDDPLATEVFPVQVVHSIISISGVIKLNKPIPS